MGKAEVEIIVTAEDKASGVLSKIGGSLRGIGTVAGGMALGGIAAVAGGFGMAMVAAIDMNASLEQSTMQFTTLMGDADAAREHVEMLFDFAAKTPFESQEIIAASKHLQIFGGEALNTEENLTLIGDAAAAVGAPFDEVAFWTGRLYSNLQAGQPFGEAAMRLQELGIMAPETRQQLEAMQKAGEDGPAVWDAYSESMTGFGGAMELQSGSWSGLMSTLKDTFSMAAAEGLKPFFDLAKEGLGGLVEWLNSPEIQEGITKIAEGFKGLIERVGEFVTGTVIPFVQEHGEQLKAVLAALGITILATLLPAVVSLAVAMAPIVLVVAAIIAGAWLLSTAWQENWGGIQEKTTAVIEFIRPLIEDFINNLRAWWDEHGAAILAKVQEMWLGLQTAAQTFIDWARPIIEEFLAAIKQFWDEHGEAIKQTAEDAWNLIKGVIDDVTEQIKDIFDLFRLAFEGDWEAFGAKLFEIWEDGWNTIVNFLSGLWDMMLPFLTNIWESMKAWFQNTDWPALGKQIINGIIAGVNAMGDALGDVLQGIVDAAIQRIKTLLGIASPSKVMRWYGEQMGAGLVQGIDNSVGAVQRAVGGMVGSMGVGGPTIGINGMAAGGGGSVVVNIDARGAAAGVEQGLRGMIEDVLRDYGARADMRIRTGY